MELNTWIAYAGLAMLVIVLPGPAAILCMHHGMRHGSRRALATVAGGTLSALVLMTASSLGVWQLVAAAPAGFELLRACGAGCLVLLGLGTWRALRPTAEQRVASATRPAKLLRDGFLLGIGNPKDLLFFGALLPQFLDPSAAQWPQLAAMFATWALIDGLAMSGYAALGHRLLHWLGSPRRKQLFQRASGLVLMGSGLTLGIASPVFGH